MKSRYIKQTVIAALLASISDPDAEPAGATDAILVTDMSITPLDAQNIDRKVVRGGFGASEQLVGPASVKINYTVELAGSGTPGTPAPWGKLLQACSVAEHLYDNPPRVEYVPISEDQDAIHKSYYDAGVLHKVRTAMGEFSFSAKAGEIPKLTFDWIGLDGGVSAANTTGNYSKWKKPVPITKANVIDITLGAAYADGELTDGDEYPSTGLDMKAGNQVQFDALASQETVDIVDRESTGSIELQLSAAQEVALAAKVKSNETTSLAFTIGLAAGNKIIFFAPRVQLLNWKKVDRNGKRLVGYDLRFIPDDDGIDWRIVVL
jgi:hypothetical protein